MCWGNSSSSPSSLIAQVLRRITMYIPATRAPSNHGPPGASPPLCSLQTQSTTEKQSTTFRDSPVASPDHRVSVAGSAHTDPCYSFRQIHRLEFALVIRLPRLGLDFCFAANLCSKSRCPFPLYHHRTCPLSLARTFLATKSCCLALYRSIPATPLDPAPLPSPPFYTTTPHRHRSNVS